MDQDAKVERLLEMLRRAAEQLPEKEAENAKRILSRKLLRKKLQLQIEAVDSKDEDLELDCRLISGAMNETLEGQPGSIEHKQRLWEVFNVWLAVMEKEYGFSISRPLRPFLESEDGKLIQLLKGLHGTDGLGCEREPLCDTIGVKEKTLRTFLPPVFMITWIWALWLRRNGAKTAPTCWRWKTRFILTLTGWMKPPARLPSPGLGLDATPFWKGRTDPE